VDLIDLDDVRIAEDAPSPTLSERASLVSARKRGREKELISIRHDLIRKPVPTFRDHAYSHFFHLKNM
jgi:hypothetical protein